MKRKKSVNIFEDKSFIKCLDYKFRDLIGFSNTDLEMRQPFFQLLKNQSIPKTMAPLKTASGE